jgi:precorrin-3B synthase
MSMSREMRRGWCPGMLRPMETGDGLLVRLHPWSGTLTASQAGAIADAARRFGNGLLDISSRGNVQIRGVTADSHAALVAHLSAAGLADGVRPDAPYRLCLTSPLAGMDASDLIDASALAERIEAETSALAGLPAKVSIVVDGGGAMPLDGIDADLRLVALDEKRLAVGLMSHELMSHGLMSHGLMSNGAPDWVGTVSLGSAAPLVRNVLERFGILHRDRPDLRRVRDLSPSLRMSLIQGLDIGAVMTPPSRSVGITARMRRC